MKLKDFKMSKSILKVLVVTGLILPIPYLAMRFNWLVTDPGNPAPETVNWNLFDFVTAGILLFGSGMTYEIVSRLSDKVVYKIVSGIAVAFILMLIWAELAVGIFP